MEVINEFIVRGLVVGVFRENCWIVGNRNTGEAICIDPGDEPQEILALSRDMGVTIKRIANSHAHLDHVLGVRGVQNETGADFLLHNHDLKILSNGWETSAQKFGVNPEEPSPEPSYFVKDGDSIEVEGVKLQVITTPGHTPGSVSYYSDQGFLFSGDTLFRGSIGRTDLPEGDYNQEMRSICEKLFQLPDETNVLPGHMSETTIGFERQNNPFVQNWLKSLK